MVEIDASEAHDLIQCIHNATWMTNHEEAMIAADPHILLLNPAQRARCNTLISKLMQARDG